MVVIVLTDLLVIFVNFAFYVTLCLKVQRSSQKVIV